MGKANRPNRATREWAGKTDRKDPTKWKPHTGKWKVIKLPPNAGVAPEMTEMPEMDSGTHVDRRYMW